MSFKVNDLKLIELIKLNKQLYDKSHGEYHDSAKKSLIWKAIGVALGTTGEFCRRRFRCLKYRFNKERRKSDMMTNPKLPLVFKKMRFLSDYLPLKNDIVAIEVEVVDSTELQEEVDKQIRILKECGEPELISTEKSVCVPVEVILTHEETAVECASEEDVVEAYIESELNSFVNDAKKIVDEVSNGKGDVADEVEENPEETSSSKGQDIISDTCDEGEDNPGETSSSKQQNIISDTCDEGEDNLSETSSSKRQNIISDTCHETEKSPRKTVRSSSKPKSIPGTNHARGLPNKRRKLTGGSVTQTSNTRMLKSCNESFCALAKQYLDEINSRGKMSRIRLQIMTLLHNELYSKCK